MKTYLFYNHTSKQYRTNPETGENVSTDSLIQAMKQVKFDETIVQYETKNI